MSITKLNDAVKQYNQVGVAASVESADPHRLIQMLMQGALEKVAIAKGYMEREDIANKGAHISWAISIVEGLRASLNKDQGGEIAQNLDDLYDYMIRRLLRANVENNIDILDEVSSLLTSVKTAWDEVPEHLEQPSGNTADGSSRPADV
ncbi:MAG: flagellar export chaperone FliS [Gammaproteobacteria bacterium]|nr:flagellar export chaperone FliS [Gammaproteobacteria bacterium]MDH5777372.1 flagellar export chaperone FliS [Gammaproteobacteria bacterium]